MPLLEVWGSHSSDHVGFCVLEWYCVGSYQLLKNPLASTFTAGRQDDCKIKYLYRKWVSSRPIWDGGPQKAYSSLRCICNLILLPWKWYNIYLEQWYQPTSLLGVIPEDSNHNIHCHGNLYLTLCTWWAHCWLLCSPMCSVKHRDLFVLRLCMQHALILTNMSTHQIVIASVLTHGNQRHFFSCDVPISTYKNITKLKVVQKWRLVYNMANSKYITNY
jgi:hypothetical protein